MVAGGRTGRGLCRKADFQWISLIRLPEFVTREVFDCAVGEAAEKKRQDFSEVEFFPGRKGSASSACTSAPMTTSRHCRRHAGIRRGPGL